MGVIQGQTAGWNDAMYVGMMLKLLIPGMQNTEEPDLGPQMLRIGRDGK
jgi:hypothetical protein